MTAAILIVLVLSFGMLGETRLSATVWLLRWHLLATAAAVGAALGTADIWMGAACVALLLASFVGLGGMLARLERRTGADDLRAASRTAFPLIGAGIGLTVLAVLAVTGVGAGSARQAEALGLAAALLGLLAASRPGSPALVLARIAMLGDGLASASATAHLPVLTAGSLLLAPCVLGVAAATIGRAGGLPSAVGDEG